MRSHGGYDEGYRLCPCFWGTRPASMLLDLAGVIGSFSGRNVLDAGCGEGKNAVFCAGRGATVMALDVSGIAISKAQRIWDCTTNIAWQVADIRKVDFPPAHFDIVIAYGLLHCLPSEFDIQNVIRGLQETTKEGGYNVVCAMNDRYQELAAHPDLEPCLISHESYLSFYRGWTILTQSDADLLEVHPHNGNPHRHSMTRLIARKD